MSKTNEHDEDDAEFEFTEDDETSDDDKSKDDKSKSKDEKGEKPKETKESRIARMRREVERFDRQNGKKSSKKDDDADEEDEDDTEKRSKKSENKGFSRLDKIVLKQEGISSQEDIDFVKELMEDSGKTLEQLLDSRYFKAEWAAYQEDQNTQKATKGPNNKRGTQVASNEIEYWLKKGETPKDNPELARKVVEARRKSHQKTNVFAEDAIV